MGEEEIRKFINQRSFVPDQKISTPRRRVVAKRPTEKRRPEPSQELHATHLFCPRCKQAMPVRESVLFYLSDGNLFQYSCEKCGTSLGTRKV